MLKQACSVTKDSQKEHVARAYLPACLPSAHCRQTAQPLHAHTAKSCLSEPAGVDLQLTKIRLQAAGMLQCKHTNTLHLTEKGVIFNFSTTNS